MTTSSTSNHKALMRRYLPDNQVVQSNLSGGRQDGRPWAVIGVRYGQTPRTSLIFRGAPDAHG